MAYMKLGLIIAAVERVINFISLSCYMADSFQQPLWPPKTAATIDVLDLYDFMSYESKVSAFEFYYALQCLTDNVGIQPPRVCFILL